MCIWQRDRCLSPWMPLNSRLDDCHIYSWNWVTVARPIGSMKWLCTPLCQVFQWPIITYLDAEYSQSIKEGPLPPTSGWLYSLNTSTRNHKEQDQTKLTRYRHKCMPKQKWGVASRGIPFPNSLDWDRQMLRFKILNFFIVFSFNFHSIFIQHCIYV